MKPLDAAWLAGITDGEGHIGVTHSRKNYALSCRISMTHKKTVLRLGELMGCSVRRIRPKCQRHNDCFYVRLYGHVCASFLLQILPYLVTKKRQAELGIELAKVQSFSASYYCHRLKRQQAIYWRMKQLNKRGL